MKFITLPKVLEFFESGELFNLKFITCDYTVIMKLKTDKSKLALHAGEIIKIERCLLSLLKKNKTNKKLVNTNIFQGKKKKTLITGNNQPAILLLQKAGKYAKLKFI